MRLKQKLEKASFPGVRCISAISVEAILTITMQKHIQAPEWWKFRFKGLHRHWSWYGNDAMNVTQLETLLRIDGALCNKILRISCKPQLCCETILFPSFWTKQSDAYYHTLTPKRSISPVLEPLPHADTGKPWSQPCRLHFPSCACLQIGHGCCSVTVNDNQQHVHWRAARIIENSQDGYCTH